MTADEARELVVGDLVFTRLVTDGRLVIGEVTDVGAHGIVVRWDGGEGVGVATFTGPTLALWGRDRRARREGL